jgi:hypothetical protein
VQSILKNVTITPYETKGRSVQDTKEILSYMIVASLEIKKQKFSSTTTVKTTTTTQKTSQLNNYYYYYYSEESNPIIVQVSLILFSFSFINPGSL